MEIKDDSKKDDDRLSLREKCKPEKKDTPF